MDLSQIRYAGFFPRVIANFIDALVCAPIVWFLYFKAMNASFSLAAANYLAATLVYWMYDVYFHARWGQTLGKMATHIKVVKLNFEPIEFREALLRYSVNIGLGLITVIDQIVSLFLYLKTDPAYQDWLKALIDIQSFSLLPTWFGILSQLWFWSEVVSLLFNHKRRAFHDFIAGTVVIHTQLEA